MDAFRSGKVYRHEFGFCPEELDPIHNVRDVWFTIEADGSMGWEVTFFDERSAREGLMEMASRLTADGYDVEIDYDNNFLRMEP